MCIILFFFKFSCFTVNIESVGAIPPNELFVEAVKVLKNKCFKLLQELDQNQNSKKKHNK